MKYTNKMTARQDFVDILIHNLLEELSKKTLEWDIEFIGEIRDVIMKEFEKRHIMTPDEFYP